ncbi:MAG: cytochrome d ubiquinol oxidase subunit II [Saprospiraceae bacterium]|nr:cytochrome d ubiquinol oxidase subunit II [Saprospiraceae bacterium]
MTYTDGVLFFLGCSLLFYLILGGADLGAGILELLLGKKSIATIDKAIAPVWEANHMWLIIAVVILFNGFPKAYALLSTALHIPLLLVLIGIILRGTAFTFRHYDAVEDGSRRIYSAVFRYSSAITVFGFGLILGPLISGNLQVDVLAGFMAYYINPWLTGFAICLGVFLMSLTAYVASIYLLGEVSTDKEYETIGRKTKTLFSLSILSGIGLFLFSKIEGFQFHYDFFTHPLSLTSMVLATLLVPFMFRFIRTRKIWPMRITVAVQMTLILIGMLFIHYPNFAIFSNGSVLTIQDCAAPEPVMKILFWSLVIGLLIIFPALAYLIKIFKTADKQY